MSGNARSDGLDGALASSVPKAASSMLSNLFRTKSRDSDNGIPSGAPSGSSTPPNGHKDSVAIVSQNHKQAVSTVKGDEASKRDAGTGSKWLLHRRGSEKKSKDKPERLKGSLFGHNTGANASDVKGAVKDDWPMYSGKAEDYEIGETIGFGATSVVRLATYKPLNQVVAVKVMDFEGKFSIRMMQREVELMSLSKHPNILRVRGDWVDGTRLCIATRFIPAGSLLDIMEYSFRDGLDEIICATILKQAAEGMHYLHINGWLHRDIKAGNLLIDEDGTVLISDFGCSSQVFTVASEVQGGPEAERETSPEEVTLRTRKSFVGTPSWMAPEVVEQLPYDSKADIWSFGITAIEIATGRAPHSLYTPAQILMKTVAEKAPTLELDGHAHAFSKSFKDMIDTCLKKDASKRPTAEKLLGHTFFKSAKRKSHLIGALLAGLPPVQSRQTRRSRRSISGLSSIRANTSVWDFETSPLSETFKGFSMRHASPSITSLNSHSGSFYLRSPREAQEDRSLSPPPTASLARRRNTSSIVSAHRKTMSFDPLDEHHESNGSMDIEKQQT